MSEPLLWRAFPCWAGKIQGISYLPAANAADLARANARTRRDLGSIPCRSEQGIFAEEQGKPSREQGSEEVQKQGQD